MKENYETLKFLDQLEGSSYTDMPFLEISWDETFENIKENDKNSENISHSFSNVIIEEKKSQKDSTFKKNPDKASEDIANINNNNNCHQYPLNLRF